MTRYFTQVSDEMLSLIRDGAAHMPPCLRLVREVGHGERGRWTLVEFEDDEAPTWMEGKLVTPDFTTSYADDGSSTGVWISERTVSRPDPTLIFDHGPIWRD